MTTPFVYTALGDSLTYGTGADDGQGFVLGVYQRLTETRRSAVILHQHGTVGATTSELLEKVQADETLREHVRHADLITVTSGGNDIIQAAQKMYMEGIITSIKPAMRAFQSAYELLLEELLQLNRTKERGTQVILLEIYNPLPMFTDAVLWVRFLNRCIKHTAASFAPHVKVAHVYPAFLEQEESLISEDGVHPSGDGHAVLADCVNRKLSL